MKKIKKTFFKKYIRNIIITIVGIFFIAGIVYAADYYRLNHNSSVNVGKYYTCLKNTNSTNNYFIPTKYDGEWNAFKSHYPSGVSKIRCKPAFSERNISWEIRHKDLDRTSSHPTCGSLPINYLFVYSPFGNYQKSSSNINTLTSIRSVKINGRTVYRGGLHSHDIGQCSPNPGRAREGRKIEY